MLTDKISDWIAQQVKAANAAGLVIGVSGGIDSAVTSVLAAKTGLPLLAVTMPIKQHSDHQRRADEQLEFLCKTFKNVQAECISLSSTFLCLSAVLGESLVFEGNKELALVNTRSRLRMTCLYALANARNALVIGTGNKVEDFGIGFFTKYGDGGVDISPIGDLTKTQVRELAKELGVPESIQKAAPSDGLWGDARSDEEQIGATYEELEKAMSGAAPENAREEEVLKIYNQRHQQTRHKMTMPPVCIIGE